MPKRILQGTVTSNKNDKTITVLIVRRYKHPAYKKYVTKTKKYAAHDPSNRCNIGDIVEIIEHKPISKTKKWLVKEDKVGAKK